jgi:hypothetical protein
LRAALPDQTILSDGEQHLLRAHRTFDWAVVGVSV